MPTARLIFDAPEKNADLYYATGFLAGDDLLYLECRGKKYLVLSDLEFDRGKKEARVDKILSLSQYIKKAREKKAVGVSGVIDILLKEFKIKKITVPQSTSFALVDQLRKKKYKVVAGTHPFYMERTIKTAKEKKEIAEAQRAVFKTIALAEKILRDSSIRRGLLFWKGKILTSERLRFEMDCFLLGLGMQPILQTIIACGVQGCDPHCTGSGPLKPHQAIIVDCFPRSATSRFFGDATRTFCKGKASPALKKQYAAVKFVQEMAISKIKAGVNGKTINSWIQNYFEQNGFPTKEINGYRQGFIHGTGHGLGLEIHEEPTRIAARDYILKAGHVVTVEPGLYYRKIGGVRIEDIVTVTKTGCKIMPTYPKRLEIP